jgi:hypothetical protein
MDIVFNALYKLDVSGNQLIPLPVPEEKKDLKSYILQLLDKILANSDRKGFEFRSETTEVHTRIKNIVAVKGSNMDEYLEHSKAIGERLLHSEVESDKKNNLKVDLLKGIMVVSMVKYEDSTTKVIISKADYDEFLDATTYVNRDGFPLKKRIYKAFIADINDLNVVSRVSVYDTNTGFTVYWWRDFLELQEVYTDEHNTTSVFEMIEAKVLSPIRKKNKADYLQLWNATVHYFKSKETFAADDFIASVFTGYKPFNIDLDITALESTTKSQIYKGKFDSQFKINTKDISKKFKKSIALTPQIDLNLKSDIQNLDKTIMRYQQPNGNKWVMIKSDEGFDYFGDTTIMTT